MKWLLGSILAVVLFFACLHSFWSMVYWPIREASFASGVSVGLAMSDCGVVAPSPSVALEGEQPCSQHGTGCVVQEPVR